MDLRNLGRRAASLLLAGALCLTGLTGCGGPASVSGSGSSGSSDTSLPDGSGAVSAIGGADSPGGEDRSGASSSGSDASSAGSSDTSASASSTPDSSDADTSDASSQGDASSPDNGDSSQQTPEQSGQGSTSQPAAPQTQTPAQNPAPQQPTADPAPQNPPAGQTQQPAAQTPPENTQPQTPPASQTPEQQTPAAPPAGGESGSGSEAAPPADSGSGDASETGAVTSTYNFSQCAPASPAVDNSYFADAAFIGDSLTDGFYWNSGVGTGTLLASVGMSVYKINTDRCINIGGGMYTLLEALSMGTYKKVYLMLGVNELGYPSDTMFYNKYAGIIDSIRKAQPNAVIYCQLLIPVNEEVLHAVHDPYADEMKNSRVRTYNSLILQAASAKQAICLDLYSVFADANGSLPAEYTGDGYHLKSAQYKTWLSYLQTHTVDPAVAYPNGMPAA